jgi:5-carboxymethyl-2-hydroxymuconate isomerase
MSNSCSGRSARSTRETNEKLAAAVRDLAAATAEIAVLQLALAKLDGDARQRHARYQEVKQTTTSISRT